jgi:hypothetical protein
MNETLFHPAIWMPVALFIVGIAVFLVGNARVKPVVRNAGAGIVALTFAWMTTAYFVDTFSEKCVKRTNAIIAAVEEGKWPELAALIDKNTRLADMRGPEEISRVTEAAASMYQLKEIRILTRDVALPLPNGVDVTINTYNEGQQNSTSTFTFSYEQRPDGILLRQIIPVSLNGRPMAEIERAIGRFSK